MRAGQLFLIIISALTSLVSCDLLETNDLEETAGHVTIDKEKVSVLTSVSGKDSDGNQKWIFKDGEDARVKVASWRCRDEGHGHIGYYVTEVELDIPDVISMRIPLERQDGDYYISGNKSVSGAHLNQYRISEDGGYLEFDLSITLYRETDGDIRVIWSGPVS